MKTGKLTHQDLGQLQMYVNYYDRNEKLPDENATIGILLCTEKNNTVVRMTLPEDNQSILASEYKLYLPSSEQLIEEINEVKKLAQEKRKRDEGFLQLPLAERIFPTSKTINNNGTLIIAFSPFRYYIKSGSAWTHSRRYRTRINEQTKLSTKLLNYRLQNRSE